MQDADITGVINALAGFLTPEQAKAAMAWLYCLSIVWAGARWVLAKWFPRFSATAGMTAFDRLLDVVFANSRKLEVRSNVARARASVPFPKRKSVPPGVALALCLMPLLGCAGTAEQHTRTVLDTLALIVEPAYQLAFEQCAREKAALVEAQKPAEFEAAVARCAKVVDAFDRIATLQDAAATALEAGRVQQAEDMVKQVASLWRGMRGGP